MPFLTSYYKSCCLADVAKGDKQSPTTMIELLVGCGCVDTRLSVIQSRLRSFFLMVCMCVRLCVFIKLHITAQSSPVILVIMCHSH